jgi:hypothetical protein
MRTRGLLLLWYATQITALPQVVIRVRETPITITVRA